MSEITRSITTKVALELPEVERILREAVAAPDEARVTIDSYDGVEVEWTVAESRE